MAAASLFLAGGAAAGPAAGPPTDLAQAGATKFTLSGDWLAAGAGSVWLSDPPARVIRQIDPSSAATTAAIEVAQVPCQSPDVAFGSVWTATCGVPGLARIDPATHKVSGFVRLSIWHSLGGEGSVGAGSGGVWMIVNGPGCQNCRVARLDPKSLRVIAQIPVAERSSSVRVGYGAVWVVAPLGGTVQKINPSTNRVVATTVIGHRPRFFDVGERACGR